MLPFRLNESARVRVERIGQEFLIDFLARATERDPTNAQALAELAHVLTREGRLEEGLDADRRLLRLRPDSPTVHYNLGCSLALLGRIDDALDALERAVRLGFDDADHLIEDEDLASLREESRFRSLLRRVQRESSDVNSR